MTKLTLHLFFRRIEVEAQHNIPNNHPVIFVPNHTNALIDPLLIIISTSRVVTVTAKNVLAKNPFLGALLAGVGAVTFHRRQDVGKGSDTRR